MTISSTTRKAGPFFGNDATIDFPFTFKVFKKQDLSVTLTDLNGADSAPLILDSAYTVTLNANQDSNPGGTVRYPRAGLPLPTGYRLTITGGLANTQPTDIQNSGGFYPQVVEDMGDRSTIQIQQLQEQVDRSLKFSVSDTGAGAVLPPADIRANKILAFDGDGKPSVLVPVSGSAADVLIQLAGGGGSSLVGFRQVGVGAVARTVQDRLRDSINVRDFGAKGDAVTDDRTAIIAADVVATMLGKSLEFPDGVYRSSNGIDKTAKWRGVGAPVIGVFPVVDDKRFLRPGQKSLIPGTSLLFTGTGTLTKTTPRADMFSSFTYCVRDVDRGSSMEGMAIILDCDVYDAGGNLTLPANDNRASYDVGRFIDDASQCYSRDVAVFGYFAKAGTVVYSQIGNDDPDYNIFDECSTMGMYGLALIGGDTATPIPNGLSGTQGYGFDIWSMDHHSRAPDNAAAQYAGADAWRCLYIDVNTTVSTKGNGHAFYGGCIRTYADHPLGLDHCNNVRFYGTVFEETSWGVTGSTTTTHLATVSTTDVSFIDTRHSKDSLFHAGFAGAMTGQLIAIGSPLNASAGMVVSVRDPANNGQFNWTRVSADGISGDPYIQLGTGSVASATTGWSMRRDIDASNIFDLRYNAASVAQLSTAGLWVPEVGNAKKIRHQRAPSVIASGSIAFTRTWAIVTTGTGSGGTLQTITGGTQGDEIIITAGLTAEPITVDTAAGNIRIGANTVVSGFVNLCLVYNGSFWVRKSG
ncbi:glycosyl hydrolase family 28-related protein [Achromobacter pestifer]|uniref:Rhamnogalacturonase A/B/Epimerase-like pectate lyase domain-containing protein n=1 Tax=Achromobacter pestifer TaxID=1353889 RepID=A0A6S6YMX4_9BURK|nr:glycosyl hydrolase family 28-related protein [Achromobacter pestifer]CAB3624728.1 hypothetical protein LMG3431_00058 [Achromobacter pestifer]